MGWLAAQCQSRPCGKCSDHDGARRAPTDERAGRKTPPGRPLAARDAAIEFFSSGSDEEDEWLFVRCQCAARSRSGGHAGQQAGRPTWIYKGEQAAAASLSLATLTNGRPVAAAAGWTRRRAGAERKVVARSCLARFYVALAARSSRPPTAANVNEPPVGRRAPPDRSSDGGGGSGSNNNHNGNDNNKSDGFITFTCPPARYHQIALSCVNLVAPVRRRGQLPSAAATAAAGGSPSGSSGQRGTAAKGGLDKIEMHE
jgi:hypothetical protein